MSEHGDDARPVDALAQQIHAVLRGHSDMTVLPALLLVLLTVVGVRMADLGQAEAYLDSLPDQLKPELRLQWNDYRAHREKMARPAEPA